MKKILAILLAVMLTAISFPVPSITVSASSPDDIFDDLVDFSKMYASSETGALTLHTMDPALPDGDMTALLKLNNDAQRFVTYEVNGSVNVTVEYVNYGGDVNYAKNKMYVFQSDDNITYTEVSCASNMVSSKNGWFRMNVVSNATADTTQFIKVVYDNSYPANWTPMMASVLIEHINTVPEFTGITDDLTDFSKTFATSGSGTLNFWNGDNVNYPAGDINGIIKANHDAERYVTYKVSGSVEVSAEYFMNSGDVNFAKNKIGVFYSADNVTFTEASCASNLVNQHANGWKRMNVISSALPDNVQYIKLVLDRSANVWDSILVSASIQKAAIAPFVDINDDLTDLSKTFATSGSTTLSSWTGDTVNFPEGDINGYIKVNHDAERYITYKVSGCVQVTAEYLINSGDEDFSKNKVELYYSADNLTYKKIVCESNLINQHVNGWERMNIVSNPLPENVQYVKLVLDRSAQVWDSIIVHVNIVASALLPVSFHSYRISQDSFISGISENISPETFINDAYTADGVSVSLLRNELELGVNDKVGTGVIAHVNTGSTTLDYTIILKGDVNGDGDIAVSDLASMKMHLLKSSELTGAFKKAGSIFGDTNITISDLLAVKKHLLNISAINQG